MVAVSVVMPVYNGERYLRQAVESILTQSFTDFELIIVDDCSSDSTPRLLDALTDPRVRVHHLTQNGGVASALNTGWQQANALYVAVMHADDVSLPHRLATQHSFLEQHPEIGILGTSIHMIDQAGNFVRAFAMETSAALAGWELHFTCPLVHSSVMMRRSVLEAVKGYRTGMRSEEDYDLWSRAGDHTQIASLPDVLLHYRTWEGSITSQNLERMERISTTIVQETVTRRLNQQITYDEASFLRRLVGSSAGKSPTSRRDVQRVAQILHALYHSYLRRAAFPAGERQALALNVALKLGVLCRLSLHTAPEQAFMLALKALRLYPSIVQTVIRMRLNTMKQQLT